MKHEGTFELFSYWNRLRGIRRAPVRTEIEPGDIRKRLADTFILEGDGASDAVFRLAGTRICANHGRELKGVSFASLWSPEDHGMIARVLRTVFNDKKVAIAAYEGVNDRGRNTEFELLLLPLEGDTGDRRLLGSAFAIEPPYWLGAHPLVRCELQSIRIVDPDRNPLLLKNRPAVELSERRPALGRTHVAGRPANGYRRIGHLAVFDGGKQQG